MAWETPHKARWAELGVHVGYSAPTGAKTPAQWLASGSGLFAWLDLSGLSAAQTLQAVAAALSLSPGTPTLTQVNAQTLQAVAAAMLLQAGTPTLTQVQSQTLTAAAANLLLVAGTPTISQARALSAVAGALALTPGTPTLTQTAGSTGITYVGAGTVAYNGSAADGSTLSVPLPAGIASGDLLLIVYGAGTSAVPAAPAGWTDSAAVFAGAAFVAGNACWKRAGSSETAPAIGVFGDDGEGPVATANVARMYAFRGVVASGSPFDAAATFAFGSGTAVTGSARTTATANAMIVMAGGHATANTTYSTPGASVDTLIEAHGSTYGIFLAYDDAPSNSAGAKAAPTAVQSASVAWGVLSFALKPA